MTMATAGQLNRAFYEDFWGRCSDFSRYNPGARHRRRLFGRVLRGLTYRSVLDVGCGDGENLLFIRSQSPEGVAYTGADLSPRSVAENAQRLPFARFLTLDIERESLAETFDLVTFTEVLEHLDDPAAAVRNLSRMVAPGGHLLVTCPTGKVHATERHFGHVAHPTERTLTAMLAQAGLQVASLHNWGFPTYVAFKYATNTSSKWALRHFGTSGYTLLGKALCHAIYVANFANLHSSPFGCELVGLALKPHPDAAT
jgi:2-polyprenyl-3-methyl-5-hydroxy-6-metoxy-1,4-benzoquinol methylase